MEQYRKDLAYYPKNIDKMPAAAGLPFDALVGRVRAKTLYGVSGQLAPTITQSTLDGYLTVAANFLEFCKRQYAVNPTLLDGFKVKTVQARKGVSRRAFNQKELQAFLARTTTGMEPTTGVINIGSSIWPRSQVPESMSCPSSPPMT